MPLLASGAFLLHRELGGRSCLQTLVGDRQSAHDRQPVRARREPRLRTLDRLQLITQISLAALIELVLVEVGRLVARVEILVLRMQGAPSQSPATALGG